MLSQLKKISHRFTGVKVVASSSGGLVLVIFISLGLYAFGGHRLIEGLYRGDMMWLSDRIMAGRKVTSLGDYFRKADEVMLSLTVWIACFVAVLWLVIAIIRKPLELILVTASFVLSSFLLFCLFEVFPSFITIFHLDTISRYYAYRAFYTYDEELVYQEKPFTHSTSHDFRGSHYSPLYGIDVQPVVTDYSLDENGFRNPPGKRSADMIIIGDSYIAFGDNESDTFPGRLEKKLPGLSVVNLGVSGYGPNQYLYVLKRYGLKYKPTFAVFAFYEGNDLSNIEDYLQWKRLQLTANDDVLFVYRVPQMSFIERYWEVLMEIPVVIHKQVTSAVKLALHKMAEAGGYLESVHPDLASLTIGNNKTYRILFVDRARMESSEELARTPAWRTLKDILRDFREICTGNRITPIFLYIPAAVNVYGQYSTDASGKNWLAVRDKQIAAKRNTEEAVKRLVRELEIDYISLSPVFEAEAKKGQLLYMQLDSHWNSEGREAAARFVADAVKAKFISAANKSQKAIRQTLGLD